MSNNTTTTPAGATLTQSELFQRFLEAPFYEGNNLSTLVTTRRIRETPVMERFGDFNSRLWFDMGLHELILEGLYNSDNPEYDLDVIVNDIAGMLRDFEELQRGFDTLCAATRVDDLEEVRYVLVEQKAEDTKLLRVAHAAISRLLREGVVA